VEGGHWACVDACPLSLPPPDSGCTLVNIPENEKVFPDHCCPVLTCAPTTTKSYSATTTKSYSPPATTKSYSLNGAK
jgi:hypothetical protein